ncbi:MAG: MBL fold metallo-hydrolase [Patescibacteria group bacterium]
MQKSNLNIFHAVILLTLVGITLISFKAKAQYDGLLRIYVMDVGQGDAIFIQAPDGNQVLIDGGPDASVLDDLAKIMPPTDRSIDAIIVSHPHSDHIGGLPAVLEQYDVGAVVEAGENYDSAIFRTWQQSVDSEGAQKIDATAGITLNLGQDATITVLNPLRSASGITTKSPHDYNVTVMLRYGQMEMLLTGDMEADVEQKLIASGINLDADILKVGHHGSKTSTSSALLNSVTPEVALISVGVKNRYNHPHLSTLQRLEDFKIPYYRTDTDGTITITSDGDRFIITRK